MSVAHALEAALADAAFAGLGSLPWRTAVGAGAGLGAVVRALGVRRRVARENLAIAFPDRTAAERESLLVAHYRELGRIAAEYGRLPELARAPIGPYVSRIEGEEVLHAHAGRGAILMTGHYGNFEMLGAHLARFNPVDFLVKPQSNAAVDARITKLRHDAGVGTLSTSGGVKSAVRALRAGRWLALVADQDARRHGIFVDFFGRPASTPEGPARLALLAGVPILFGVVRREADGRHMLAMHPARATEGRADDEVAVRALTEWHVRVLEDAIRVAPEHWFWLHKRWKTRPPGTGGP